MPNEMQQSYQSVSNNLFIINQIVFMEEQLRGYMGAVRLLWAFRHF